MVWRRGATPLTIAAPSLGLGFLASYRLALDHRFVYQDRDVMIIFQVSELDASSDVDVDEEGVHIILILHPWAFVHNIQTTLQPLSNSITNARTLKLYPPYQYVFSRRSVRAKERCGRR